MKPNGQLRFDRLQDPGDRQPALLAAGYFAHGGWDVLHHLGALPTLLPEWYVPFCLGYDGIVGAYLLAAFPRAPEA